MLGALGEKRVSGPALGAERRAARESLRPGVAGTGARPRLVALSRPQEALGVKGKVANGAVPRRTVQIG